MSRTLEIIPEGFGLQRRKLKLIDGLVHVAKPYVAVVRIHGEITVPHPQPGMAAML